MKKWRTLEQKYLFQNKPWLTVRADKLEMPNGHIMEPYYVFEYPDWVNTIAVTRDEQMILITQYRHAIGEVNYELSAGICDATDPNHLFSAQRELLEETGYGGGQWEEYMISSANPGTHTNLTYCYLATDVDLRGTQNLDQTEDIEVHLLSKKDVYEMLCNNTFRQSLHAGALWKYFALNPI